MLNTRRTLIVKTVESVTAGKLLTLISSHLAHTAVTGAALATARAAAAAQLTLYRVRLQTFFVFTHISEMLTA